MTVSSPLVLLLLTVPAGLAAVAWWRRAEAPAVVVADWEVLREVPHSWRERWRRVPALLRLVALLLLVTAAAGPVLAWRQVAFVPVPADVMILIDASGSMQAMDLQPDRFDAARRLATGLIAARPDDRIGVMAFGGRTVTLSPPTLDHLALTGSLRAARASATDLEEGTALGAALAGAVEKLGGVDGRRRGGLVVVLTDGATNDGLVTPDDAMRLAVRRGIRVHAVGLGRDGRVPYPTDVGVIDVSLPVRDAVLRRIAEGTGGRYWRVADEAGLAGVLAALPRGEGRARLREERTIPRSFSRELVMAAAVLLVLELALASGPLRVRTP